MSTKTPVGLIAGLLLATSCAPVTYTSNAPLGAPPKHDGSQLALAGGVSSEHAKLCAFFATREQALRLVRVESDAPGETEHVSVRLTSLRTEQAEELGYELGKTFDCSELGSDFVAASPSEQQAPLRAAPRALPANRLFVVEYAFKCASCVGARARVHVNLWTEQQPRQYALGGAASAL